MKYGYLTVLEEFKGSDRPWDVRCRCVCDCGNEVTVYRCNLRSGKTKSCGCMSSKMRAEHIRKTNQYRVEGDVAIGIATNTGNEFYLDATDLDIVRPLTWYEQNNGYMVHKEVGKPIQTMHRLIMGNPKGFVIDHINHNRLDNRRNNLRICTQKENSRNQKMIPKGIREVFRKNKSGGGQTYYIVELRGYRGCFKEYNEAKELRDKIIEEEYIQERGNQ